MKKVSFISIIIGMCYNTLPVNAAIVVSNNSRYNALEPAIVAARNACGAISPELIKLKNMAGINIAVNGVGAAAGGVALGAGLKKNSLDTSVAANKKAITKLQNEIDTENEKLAVAQAVLADTKGGVTYLDKIRNDSLTDADRQILREELKELDEEDKQKLRNVIEIQDGQDEVDAFLDVVSAVITEQDDQEWEQVRKGFTNEILKSENAIEKQQKDIKTKQTSIEQKQALVAKQEKQAETMANVRTGTMAAATAANVAGAAVGANVKVSKSLQAKIDACIAAVDNLNNAMGQRHSADADQISTAQQIINGCSGWADAKIAQINKKSKITAAAGGVGAAVALAGMITSISAHNAAGDKAKQLDTTSNVLAGASTGASAIATVSGVAQTQDITQAIEIDNQCTAVLQ